MQLDGRLDEVLSPNPAAGRRARSHDKFFFLSDVGNAALRGRAPDSFLAPRSHHPTPPSTAAKPCALFGKPLKRTPVPVRLLATKRAVRGLRAAIHGTDRRQHPMEMALHGMEMAFHGHFREEKSHRFSPNSGKNRRFRELLQGSSRVIASISSPSNFRVFAHDGAVARKYRILRVKKRPPDKASAASHAATAARENAHVETRFIASHPLGAKPRNSLCPSGARRRTLRWKRKCIEVR